MAVSQAINESMRSSAKARMETIRAPMRLKTQNPMEKVALLAVFLANFPEIKKPLSYNCKIVGLDLVECSNERYNKLDEESKEESGMDSDKKFDKQFRFGRG